MKKRKRLALLLAAVLLLTNLLAAPAAAVSVGDFRDVRSTDWFYDAVDYVVEANLFNGTGADSFSPNKMMTRGMFVTVLGRRALIDKSRYSGSSFSDVKVGQYYAPYVEWATGIGIVNGTGNGRFSPEGFITREDLITLLYRYVQYCSDTPEASLALGPFAGDYSKYSDRGQVSSYAQEPMKWAVSCKFVTGVTGTTIAPKNKATRAQVAKIFMESDYLLDYVERPGEPPKEDFEEIIDEVDESLADALKLALEGKDELDAEAKAVFETAVEDLERQNIISDVEWDDAGNMGFTFADGVQGIFAVTDDSVSYSQDASSAQAADIGTQNVLSSLPGDGGTLDTESFAAGLTRIGKTDVKIISALPRDAKYDQYRTAYKELETTLRGASKDMGIAVESMTTTPSFYDFQGLGNYGAVFISAVCEYYLYDPYIILNEDAKSNVARYRKQMEEGHIRYVVRFTPDEIKKFANGTTPNMDKNRYLGVHPSFFADYYKSQSLDKTYIHLGFTLGTRFAEALKGAGATSVSYYPTPVDLGFDCKNINTVASEIVKARDTTVDRGVQQAYRINQDRVYTHTWIYHRNWVKAQKKYETALNLMVEPNLTLWQEEQAVTPIPPGSITDYESYARQAVELITAGNISAVTNMVTPEARGDQLQQSLPKAYNFMQKLKPEGRDIKYTYLYNHNSQSISKHRWKMGHHQDGLLRGCRHEGHKLPSFL